MIILVISQLLNEYKFPIKFLEDLSVAMFFKALDSCGLVEFIRFSMLAKDTGPPFVFIMLTLDSESKSVNTVVHRNSSSFVGSLIKKL